MREKYYNLIEELIRKHRKFNGLEAILDDIIDDVLQHSEVVIGNISNESVVHSYLEKVVSTSIITVPKKLNFHPEISHRVISTSPIINEIVHKSVNNELVDRMINGSFVSNKTEEHEASLTYETLNESFENIEVQELENVSEDSVELNNINSLIEEDLKVSDAAEGSEALDLIEEADVESLESIVKNQDDIIENNISNEDTGVIDPSEEANENKEELKDELSEFLESEGDSEELDYSNLIPAEEEAESENVITDAQVTPDISEDGVVSPDSFANSAEEVTVESTFEDLSNAAIVLDEEEPSEDIIELNEQVEEANAIPELNIDEEVFESPDNDNLSEAEQSQEVFEEIVEIQEDGIDDSFKEPNYDVFCFESSEVSIDEQDIKEIQAGLVELNKKHPELNIVKIFELKYKENSSVSQIALSLEMSEEDVLEALNEIVALI